jgi:hypothetical protein
MLLHIISMPSFKTHHKQQQRDLDWVLVAMAQHSSVNMLIWREIDTRHDVIVDALRAITRMGPMLSVSMRTKAFRKLPKRYPLIITV